MILLRYRHALTYFPSRTSNLPPPYLVLLGVLPTSLYCILLYICLGKKKKSRSSCYGSVVTNLTNIHEDVGLIPGLALWVKDPVLCELWCRPQMWLRSHVAVAVA